VIFIIRTRGSLFYDHPHWVLTLTTFCALGVALALPFSSVGAWFGFTILPLPVCLALVVIIVLYLLSAEMLKRFAMR
jgi:Mg2+-importing ATPase